MEKNTESEQSQTVHEWLQGKTIEDLDVVENSNRLLFADTIKRKGPKGQLIEEQVRVRVPRMDDQVKARIEAVDMARKFKIDRDKDADLFEEFETIAMLSRCIREKDDPHGQAYTFDQLYTGYDANSLYDIWNRIQHYNKMTDPRLSDPDIQDVVVAAMGIAKKKNLSPLIGIAGSDLDSFVISMASLLATYLTQPPIASSPETSISDS